MKHKPVPAIAGPKYVPARKRDDEYKYDAAMQEAIRRSERQPRLISMNSKEGGK